MSEKDETLRVFVDSNILISAVLSQKSISSQVLEYIIEHYQLVICSYSITEVSRVINNKFPNKMNILDRFLTSLEFELTYTPSDDRPYLIPHIRDEKDIPILVSLVIAVPRLFYNWRQRFPMWLLESQLIDDDDMLTPIDIKAIEKARKEQENGETSALGDVKHELSCL